MIKNQIKNSLLYLSLQYLLLVYLRGGYFLAQKFRKSEISNKGEDASQNVEKEVAETWLDYADMSWDVAGRGTENQPYIIDTAEKLAGLSFQSKNGQNFAGKFFKQTADIELGGYNWIPIGSESAEQFYGTYDGNNYKIEGMTIELEFFCGLFGIMKGKIQNINIKNSRIYCSQRYAGGLVGSLEGDGKVENCITDCNVFYSGSVTDVPICFGGVVGWADKNTQIIGVKNYGNVVCDKPNDDLGGILGYASPDGLVKNCYNYGNITCAKDKVGGIVGAAQTNIDITNCNNYGDVTGKNYVGGIVGYAHCSNITNCISDASIKGDIAGLIIGSVDGGGDGWAAVFECMAYGYLDVADAALGSIIGKMYNITSKVKIRNSAANAFSSANLTYICGLYSADQVIEEINSCYSKINNKKVYSNGDFSSWALVEGINNDFPLQKELFWIAEFGEAVSPDWFENNGFNKI